MIKIKQNTKYLNKQYLEFEKEQLSRFKKYYIEGTTDSRKELKRALYEKKDLSERQKDELWKRIIAKWEANNY